MTSVIFPGQGSQFPGMARDFYDNFREFKDVFLEIEDSTKINLNKIIFSENPELLNTNSASNSSQRILCDLKKEIGKNGISSMDFTLVIPFNLQNLLYNELLCN